ncbi:MAG: hypothetical protein KDC00_09565 [Flavobacteriales bacterium]|nr:hypothetical protein [Flavobacteriales bacterium]
MKHIPLFSAAALTVGLLISATTTAQEEPKTNYITQATSRLVVPEGEEESEFWKMQRSYFDNVISKSKLVVHYSIYRHAWGSEGATVVETMEFANWNDIDTFTSEESRALAEAAWPDEKARMAFMEKWRGYTDPYHQDEIYRVSLNMRK